MPRPFKLQVRRDRYLQDLDEIEKFYVSLVALVQPGQAWAGEQWKLLMGTELIAINAFSCWEHFSHDVVTLALAQDTTALARTTGLSIPRKVTSDVAEALLTSRGYLEFKDTGKLIGDSKKWLAKNPFLTFAKADRDSIDDLKAIRNYIAHRSRHSRDAYHSLLKRGQVVGRPTPGDYLNTGGPTRMSGHFAHLKNVAAIIV